MKQVKPFYTVIQVQSGRFTIRYVTPPNWTIQEIGRNYDDPAEAVNEFKKYERFQRHGRLTATAFYHRIRHHQQDLEKWKQWTYKN